MANGIRMTLLELFAFVCAVLTFVAIARADSTQEQLEQVMEENFAACNEENLPRLLETMSVEMPQRELFIRQTKEEWEVSDLYYRLEGVQIVKQNKWRPPYVVATVRQTIAGNEGEVEDVALSDSMNLNTVEPTTESEILFKRESGQWKVVAGLNEPRPVHNQNVRAGTAKTSGKKKTVEIKGPSCANGQCRWPKTR